VREGGFVFPGHFPIVVETYWMLATFGFAGISNFCRCFGAKPITGVRLLVSPVAPE
jgi:hypothetical protein